MKQNQKQLLNNLKDLCKYFLPLEIDIQTEELNKNSKGKRNRIETRKAEGFKPNVSPNRLGHIYDCEWNKMIRKVIRITRTIKIYDAKGKQWRTTKETAYYLVTTAKYTAKQLNRMIRNHWSIENKNHFVRDTTLEEDKSRIRKNPGIFARLRSFTLNILRHKKVRNIRKVIYQNTLDMELAIKRFLRGEAVSVG